MPCSHTFMVLATVLVYILRLLYLTKKNYWIADKLVYYAYSFLFLDFLDKQLAKESFEAYFISIQAFSRVNVEKVLNIKKLFDNYTATLTNF